MVAASFFIVWRTSLSPTYLLLCTSVAGGLRDNRNPQYSQELLRHEWQNYIFRLALEVLFEIFILKFSQEILQILLSLINIFARETLKYKMSIQLKTHDYLETIYASFRVLNWDFGVSVTANNQTAEARQTDVISVAHKGSKCWPDE